VTELIPNSITRESGGVIHIEWSDGARLTYSAAKLRAGCPCATCREKDASKPQAGGKLGDLPVLSLNETQPLSIRSMRPIGNYAYNISFSDGHDSGIYTFDLLRDLGQSDRPSGAS
jgi:DUF971 family protein